MNVVCIDDRFSKLLELNKTYKATRENNCYIIDIKENDITVNSRFRRKVFKAKSKYFVET